MPRTELYKLAERLRKSGNYQLTGMDAAKYVEDVANILGIDLNKEYDLEHVRDVLARGTPLSKIIREMRDS